MKKAVFIFLLGILSISAPLVAENRTFVANTLDQALNAIDSRKNSALDFKAFNNEDLITLGNDIIKASADYLNGTAREYVSLSKILEKQEFIFKSFKQLIESNSTNRAIDLLGNKDIQKLLEIDFTHHNNLVETTEIKFSHFGYLLNRLYYFYKSQPPLFTRLYDLACAHGQVDVVKKLIENCPLFVEDKMAFIRRFVTFNSLIEAIQNNHTALLQYFVELSQLQNIYKKIFIYFYTVEMQSVAYPACDLAKYANKKEDVLKILKPYIDQEKKQYWGCFYKVRSLFCC